MRLVEGAVGFVGANKILSGIDDCTIERDERLLDIVLPCCSGQLFQVVVEPHTQKKALLKPGPQELTEMPPCQAYLRTYMIKGLMARYGR